MKLHVFELKEDESAHAEAITVLPGRLAVLSNGGLVILERTRPHKRGTEAGASHVFVNLGAGESYEVVGDFDQIVANINADLEQWRG